MASGRKRQQTIAKRNRERAVEEKRTLKRLAKQARREAARNGELDEQPPDGHALGETDESGEPREAEVPGEPSEAAEAEVPGEPSEAAEAEVPEEPEQPEEPV